MSKNNKAYKEDSKMQVKDYLIRKKHYKTKYKRLDYKNNQNLN